MGFILGIPAMRIVRCFTDYVYPFLVYMHYTVYTRIPWKGKYTDTCRVTSKLCTLYYTICTCHENITPFRKYNNTIPCNDKKPRVLHVT